MKSLPPIREPGPERPQPGISPAGEAFVEEVVQLSADVLAHAPPPPQPAYDLPLSQRKARRVKVVANAFFGLAVLLLLLLAVTLFLNKTSPNGVGGVCFFVEPTDAMKPLITRGSLLITVHRSPADIQPGDIITYYAMRGDPDTRLTRIVAERLDDGGRGNPMFRTKRAADALPDSILINSTYIRGVKRAALPGVGYVVSFLQTYAEGLAVVAVALGVAAVLLRRFLRSKEAEKRKRKRA